MQRKQLGWGGIGKAACLDACAGAIHRPAAQQRGVPEPLQAQRRRSTATRPTGPTTAAGCHAGGKSGPAEGAAGRRGIGVGGGGKAS